MTPVGLIGLGLLGSAMAERMAAGGYVVHGFDTNLERRDAFTAAGGVFCDSASSVFKNCATVVLSLPTSKIVAEVLTDCRDQIQQHLIIDTTTGAPEDARLDLSAPGLSEAERTLWDVMYTTGSSSGRPMSKGAGGQ